MATRRVRSGSLSSASESESSEDDNRPKFKSTVQVAPAQSKPVLSDEEIHPSPSPRPHKRRRSSPSPRHHHSGRRQESPPHRGRGSRRRSPSASESEQSTPSPKRKRVEPDPLMTRTGGAYIPPAKLRMMQDKITDKSSVAYQRLSWEALKKSINGLINKVNVSNIDKIVPELFEENVVRGRGLLTRSIIQAQSASPMFSHVYAALVAVINTKFPQTGELICKRLILQFRRGFRRNEKNLCMTAVKFLGHLVNQQVLHEIAALELLTLLMEEPTDDSIEVAVGFIKECGLKLSEVSPRGALAMFETLRSVLHSGKISSRVQYMIEVLFAIRKDKFKDHPSVIEGLDLVEEDDQITHLLSLTDEFDGLDELNVFHPDPDYLANEEKYKMIKAEILGGESDSEEDSSGGEESEDEDEEEEDEEGKVKIEDMTDAKLLTLRRNIYLTIMSSANYEECVHKLVKNLQEGTESEIANMVIECCSQERSYLRFYGHMGQRLCLLSQTWVEVFDQAYQQQYATVHRLETNKLRNTARFFAQLFYSDALPWTALSCVHLNEEETTSSSRIFVKILFQELAEFMGIVRLNERLRDPLLSIAFEGLLPRDNPKNTRFAINFFTSIGLGGLTDDLREHLANTQKMIMEQQQDVSSSDTESSEEESSEDSTADSSSEASSSSSESEAERVKSKRRSLRGSSHKHRSRHQSSSSDRKESSERKKSSKGRSKHKHHSSRNETRSSSRERVSRKKKSSKHKHHKRDSNSSDPDSGQENSPSPKRVEKKRAKHRSKRDLRASDSDADDVHQTVETRGPAANRDVSPDSTSRSPSRRVRSPGDTRRRSPDVRRRSPDSRRRSPDSRRRSPDMRRRSPDMRRRSPDSRTDARRRSPDMRRRSPYRKRSPDQRHRSPNRRRSRSPRRRDRSPAIRNKSPDSQRR